MVALETKSEPGEKPTFLTRLHAWWEGYYLDVADSEVENLAEVAEPEVTPGLRPEDAEGWTRERIQAAQRVLGHGQLMAGGEKFIHHLITPLGMNEKMSILEYGARIGSVTRAVAHGTGAWVSGFEFNSLLAEAAGEISTAAGLAKKAAVESIPLEKSDIREGSRDAALSFEALYTVEDKEPPIKAMTRMLKPRGQLLITDFVRAIEQESSSDIEIWSAYEREPLHLVPVDWYTEYMESLGLDIRVVEDVSSQYCNEIVHTLNAFRISMDAKPVSDAFKPWVLWEVEYWAQRMAALQSGDVALYRFHAILK